jgi:hypothetical protein
VGEEVTSLELVILAALAAYGLWRFWHVVTRILERMSR